MDSFTAPHHDFDLQVTDDAFLGGRIQLFQPKVGFRAGTDSVLLAAAAPHEAEAALELGAGAGAASICFLANRPNSHLTLIERQHEILPVLERNLARNGLNERTQVIRQDILKVDSEENQRLANRFDAVFANPPFFEEGAGTLAPNANKSGSNHMPGQDLEQWAKLAAGACRAGGTLTMIHQACSLREVLCAFGARFGSIKVKPIHSRPRKPAMRILVQGILGSRGPLEIRDPLFLHADTGNEFSAEASDIFRHGDLLEW